MSTGMRVLVATHNYPRWSGDPAGAFVALLARALVADGLAVRVLAPHAVGLPAEANEGGVEVRRFRYALTPWELAAYGATGQRTGARRLAALASVPAFLVAYRRAVHAEARRWRADVVHAHWWMPGAAVAAGWRGPLVVTCHGTDVQLLARSRAARALARRVAPHVARWTAVSRLLAHTLVAGLGEAVASNVSVTPMPVDVPDDEGARPTAPAGAGRVPRVLYAGNLVATKGLDVLIEAIARVRGRGVAVALRIVGQGPERAALARLAEARGVTDVVDWAGPLPHTAMPAEFAAATLTVLPSRAGAEGLGLVLVEALLHGCPVVGTDAGGIPETVLHEQTGLLARAGDADDLALQITRLMTNPDLAQRLAHAGRVRAYERHAPARCAARFRALYAAALIPCTAEFDDGAGRGRRDEEVTAELRYADARSPDTKPAAARPTPASLESRGAAVRAP